MSNDGKARQVASGRKAQSSAWRRRRSVCEIDHPACEGSGSSGMVGSFLRLKRAQRL